MTRLSIVIPVLGNVAELERTLVSVLAGRPDDCEIVAVLNTAYDDPYDLADEVRFVAARPKAGFVECVNLGLQHSRSPVIHVLAAGLEPREGWADAALEQFDDPQVAAVAPLIVASGIEGRPLAAGLRYRLGGTRVVNVPRKPLTALATERIVVLGPCGVAAFYRAEALAAVGGGMPNVLGNDLADVQLALELQAAGYRAVFDARAEIVADHIPMFDGRGLQHGLYSERLFWLHAGERNKFLSLCLHPFSVLGDILAALPSLAALLQAAGRFWACCQFGFYRQPTHRQDRKAAKTKLPSGHRLDPAHETAADAAKSTPVRTGDRVRSR